MLSQYFKNIFEVIHMLGLYLALHHHIIYVDFNVFAALRLEHPSHHLLICRSCILQSEWHHFVMVILSGRNKSSLLLIIQS